jgi:hypothetical protein
MDQKLESTACDLKHVFISVSQGSSQKAKLPGDTINIPITVKFSVSHRRQFSVSHRCQKHLAVSNEMWKVNWE